MIQALRIGWYRLFPPGKDPDLEKELVRLSAYYLKLETHEKERFHQRLMLLRKIIRFRAKPGISVSEEMRITILAAIIQLTFGLKRFVFSYFRTIILEPGLYRIPQYREEFLGHVDRLNKTITLSWPNARYGFAVADDAHNVVLHEMAHVILFENTMRFEYTEFFDRKDWDNWLLLAQPLFIHNQGRKNTLLAEYADKNLMEMFAVSVETFFERPTAFKTELPELYHTLVRLLRQDPTNPGKPREINGRKI
jgi:Mlc titration factor MtfA (ptsG expression regulator)